MRTERVRIPSEGAEIDAYLAVPDGPGPWPGIIVIHEIWGLVPHIEDVARRCADAGYVALAPDLYSRGGLPVTPEEIGRAMAFMQALPVTERADPEVVGRRVAELPAGDRDVVQRTLAWLRTRDLGQSVADLRICSLGFCMGGGLSGRLATSGAALAGCVIFYGEHPPADEIANIRCPVLGLYGADDHRISDDVPDLARAMATAGTRFEHHVYAGAPHAFFNDTREATYRPEATRDAWARVLAFLAAAG